MYSLDEALSKIGFGNFQGLVLAYAGLGWVAEAMEMMILSFIGREVQVEWGLSSSEESLISTVVFAGMLIGAYSWGLVSDTYGRKKGFLGAAILTGGAGLLSAFSPNYISLVVLRFLVGIGLGCGHVFTSWFLEFVPTPKRGRWMIIFSSFWTVGTIFEASLAWIVMPRFGWRWLLVLSSLPSFVLLIFNGVIPESPRYLCMKSRTTEAYNILQKGALSNQQELPPGMLVSHSTSELNEEFASSEDANLLSARRKTLISESRTSNMSVIFSPKLIRTTLLLWLLYFGNTFSYYGIILLTSELSGGKSDCSTTAMHLKTTKDASLYLDVFVTSLAELPGLVLSAFIVDRVGRKFSMLVMFILGFILLLPLVTRQNEVLTTLLLFGARMFISATFIVACIYAPEVYPTNVRSTGVGITTAIGRIGGMVCPLVAVGLAGGCNQMVAVVVFEIMIVLSGLSVVLFPFETQGKELADHVHASA